MKWNAVLMIRYGLPVVGREAKAMEVFTDAFTTFGKLAAEGESFAGLLAAPDASDREMRRLESRLNVDWTEVRFFV